MTYLRNFSAPRWAGFVGLWSLAITKPCFDAISSGPETLTQSGAGWIDIAVLILIVAVAIPTMVVAVIGMIWLQSPALNEKLYAGCLGVLAGLIIWQDLGGIDVVLIRYGVSLAAGILFAYSYLRFEFIQNFALVLVVAAPVVIFLFVYSYPVKNELSSGQSPTNLGRASGASPIIVVVLDELSAPYLESSDGQIDEKLYPNFAKLADESTWYRNAFSAADATCLLYTSRCV